jgi:hypothetical protein
MQDNMVEQVELEPLEELFGDVEETEAEALQRLGDDDFAEAPQAIGSVVWTVRLRC